ncbi:hypothetical protein [Turneriella parva]|uniref:Cytoplasmic protein n=1 Tax=Turneriella parva (strain ATCC BAA-1111 / DSM 21527 / NCTC 11395 / H) TaxID=869212 RepID=I4B0A1_TURPD|nr:hypothetical protein [Turneriella parva]AFM10708.1 putative cytoplasmic protein [Turneriella parva DSM 21527]
MSNTFKMPEKKAVIFWPVGTGDSSTLVVKPGKTIMQIDLRHLEKAENPEEPEWPIIDHLVKSLPRREGKPYLSVFVLTHPDKDHIQGFEELLTKVTIGELWHTPKIFRARNDQEALSKDAKAFRKEVNRRREAILKNPSNIKSGDRIRIIGYDDILADDKYKELPPDCKSHPGELVTVLDGENLESDFHAFIHAPFKDDQEKDKNSTSLSLNICLKQATQFANFIFFGDRAYDTILRIFDTTENSNPSNKKHLEWDVMLSAHHCSKAAMYVREEGKEDYVLKQDIMDYFEKYARKNSGFIVSSSHSNFTSDSGDNPPHSKARMQYSKIVSAGHFVCTHEFPTKVSPEPIVFTVDEKGLSFLDKREKSTSLSSIKEGVVAARGRAEPPKTQTTFGLD